MQAPSLLILPAEHRSTILRHALESRPQEAVGLLGGTSDGRVALVLPLTNVADANRAFLADPYEQYCGLRRLKSEQLQLLAIYHSHPGGGVDPSDEDVSYARKWSCAHVIVAVDEQASAPGRWRAFRFDETSSLQEVSIRTR